MVSAIEEVLMMNLATEQQAWTEAQIMRLPDVGGKYELVEGELVVVAAGREHDDVIFFLDYLLKDFVIRHDLGRVYGASLGYWMENGNLRSPDISFVTNGRLNKMTHDPKGFLHGAPDLAIEILSPSNTVKAMKEKALEYFESGSRLVWIVSPKDRTVTVLRPDGSERVLTVEAGLDGEDVIPGFSIEIKDVFKYLE
ncbi:MAG: Uma2 family endonuclease [Pseudomonadota bacterium]